MRIKALITIISGFYSCLAYGENRCIFLGSTCPIPEKFSENVVRECESRYESLRNYLQPDDNRVIYFQVEPLPHPAEARNKTIVIDCQWTQTAPPSNDWGLVSHEMAHTFQTYISSQPKWVIEGLADYVRGRFDKTAQSCQKHETFLDGYACAASFFFYIERVYDKNFVWHLNRAASSFFNGTDDIFEERTGKTATQLWNECKPECSGSSMYFP